MTWKEANPDVVACAGAVVLLMVITKLYLPFPIVVLTLVGGFAVLRIVTAKAQAGRR